MVARMTSDQEVEGSNPIMIETPISKKIIPSRSLNRGFESTWIIFSEKNELPITLVSIPVGFRSNNPKEMRELNFKSLISPLKQYYN